MTIHTPIQECKTLDVRVRLPKISKQELLDAIREGVHDAFWHMIVNNTQAPCADFFQCVEDGVATGIERAQQGRVTSS